MIACKTVYKGGEVCVGMMEGQGMKMGDVYDPTRLVVSVAANGKIDRILGFYWVLVIDFVCLSILSE